MTTIAVVDIGGTHVKCGLMRDREPQDFTRIFPSTALRTHDPVDSLASMVRDFTRDAGAAPDCVVATVPGFLDLEAGRVLWSANLPELNGRLLGLELSALLGLPVILERDAVLALRGEIASGTAGEAAAVLGIFFGTGIGGAFIHNGAVFRGAGWAMELGHMPHRGDGRHLEGLRPDSMESYASGRVLLEIATRHGTPVDEVFVKAPDLPRLRADIAEFVRSQGFAVGAAVALMSPEVIIIGGGIASMAGYPRDELAGLVAKNAPFAETGREMDLRWARHGWQAALVGAQALVDERGEARAGASSSSRS